MIWLWLDDEHESLLLYEYYFKQNDILFKKFNNTKSLQEYLIEKKDKGNLQNYGLIIDVLLLEEREIVISKKWYESLNDIFRNTENGLYAGVSFIKNLILAENKRKYVWEPLPPIVFLTKMQSINIGDKLKNLWEVYKNNSIENRLFIHNKFEDIEELIKKIKEIENIV